jgi:N6-adenosine-specific RNA methylase IME4
VSYRTILADPPWPITWSGGWTTPGAATGSTRRYRKRPLPYSTMSIEEICALPIGDLADVDAHLFLWITDRFLIEGLAARVARAWGFEPGRLLIWRKANPGMGTFPKPAHEALVICKRGSLDFTETRATSVQDWKQPYEGGAKKHSAKPDGAYDLIEQASPGPYLELFARRQRLGWDTWGNEALGHVEIA